MSVIALLSNHATAQQDVSFSVSNSIPPFFFENTNKGVQYALLAAALDSQELHIKEVIFAPNRRTINLISSEKIDCLINAPAGLTHLYYTQSLLDYQNLVYTLADTKLAVTDIASLGTLSLMAFQNATRYLGDDFAAMAKMNPDYLELTNQQSQISLLFSRRVQAIVIEKHIFTYYRQQLNHKLSTQLPINEYYFFPPSPRPIACTNAQLAEKIDRGIHQIKANGEYRRILDNTQYTE